MKLIYRVLKKLNAEYHEQLFEAKELFEDGNAYEADVMYARAEGIKFTYDELTVMARNKGYYLEQMVYEYNALLLEIGDLYELLSKGESRISAVALSEEDIALAREQHEVMLKYLNILAVRIIRAQKENEHGKKD